MGACQDSGFSPVSTSLTLRDEHCCSISVVTEILYNGILLLLIEFEISKFNLFSLVSSKGLCVEFWAWASFIRAKPFLCTSSSGIASLVPLLRWFSALSCADKLNGRWDNRGRIRGRLAQMTPICASTALHIPGATFVPMLVRFFKSFLTTNERSYMWYPLDQFCLEKIFG